MLRKLYWAARSTFASPPPPKPEYFSRFGGLWTDRRDALTELDRRAAADPTVAALRDKLAFFIENGYVVLERTVEPADIDAYKRDLLAAAQADSTPLVASVPVQGPQDKDVVPLAQADLDAPLTKVLDTYVHLPSALKLAFADPIVRFLSIVFDNGLLAFQGLHFERGSTQAVHQDTAYVVLENPMHLCASWVALEDVQPCSGELMYYEGSHRLPDWLYSGAFKHYNHERDKHEEHMAHLKSLVDRSEERGLKLTTFLPKKGDALIWAADLAHGGSEIGDPALTRRSLVTHYTDASTKPYYFRFLPQDRQKVVQVKPGCAFTSMYY